MRYVKVCLVMFAAMTLMTLPVMVQAEALKTNIFGLDGLFYTTGSGVVAPGTLAVGGAFLVFSDDNQDAQSLPVTVTYGLSEQFEFGAAFEVYHSVDPSSVTGNSESGIGDLYLSGKYSFQEKTSDMPGAAVGFRIKIPMADEDEGLGSGETDISVMIAAETDLGSTTGMLNVEYLIPGGDDENMVNYAIGLEIPYSDTVDFTVELLDQPLVGDILSGGATFEVGSSLTIGGALGVGLNDPSADLIVVGRLALTL